MKYLKQYKKKICELICLEGKSTSKTANEHEIPLKTLEKWITSYHKNPKCFDDEENEAYISTNKESVLNDDLSYEDLRKSLMKKDIEISRLKKGYAVKGVGQSKEYAILSTKNTK